MLHQHLTQAVGKRVVGQQNMLPLIRDCAEDERTIHVTADTERGRLSGVILPSQPGVIEVKPDDRHTLVSRGDESRKMPATRVSLVLQFRIDKVDS